MQKNVLFSGGTYNKSIITSVSPILSVLLITFLFFQELHSQKQVKSHIFGIIIDAETREPIANANIFISQSSIGCASDKNGYFELRNIPYGRYELIASVIGYEVLKAKIGIYDDSRRNLRFEMYKQPIQFQEVVVSGKESWKRKTQLDKFRRSLLGSSQNGMESYIKNEEVIRFDDDKYGLLKAWADEPLEIVNNSLGYNIHYVLDDFEIGSGYVRYTGYPHFIEKTAKTFYDSVEWAENRKNTYLGSFRHFLTTICKNYEITQGDTTERITMFDLGNILKNFVLTTYGDTTHIEENGFYVLGLHYAIGETKRGIWKLVNTNNFLSEAENTNEMYLHFSDYLEVKYAKELFPHNDKKKKKTDVSWIKMTCDSTILDRQGRYFDRYAIKTKGIWSKERVADMLPFDYTISE